MFRFQLEMEFMTVVEISLLPFAVFFCFIMIPALAETVYALFFSTLSTAIRNYMEQ